jgi:hypothetical protein
MGDGIEWYGRESIASKNSHMLIALPSTILFKQAQTSCPNINT